MEDFYTWWKANEREISKRCSNLIRLLRQAQYSQVGEWGRLFQTDVRASLDCLQSKLPRPPWADSVETHCSS